MILGNLLERWRSEATLFRRRGQPCLAEFAESFAQELEDELERQDTETVSLREASRIGGYHPDHLSRMLSKGRTPNMGRKSKPRIRRKDVPRKPGCAVDGASVPVLNLKHRQQQRSKHRGVEGSRGRGGLRLSSHDPTS